MNEITYRRFIDVSRMFFSTNYFKNMSYDIQNSMMSLLVDLLDELMTLQLFKIAGMARIWILAT